MIALALGLVLAVDPFEIQVYQAESNPAGRPGIELHVNDVASGVKNASPPELQADRQIHVTLEPSFGVTDWWELGAYVQTAWAGGEYRYAGVKLRSKFIAPGPELGLRVGLNVELSWLPPEFEAGRYGAELRPIIQWSNERWLVSANPIVSLSFSRDGAEHGPAFEPAVTVLRRIAGKCDLGLEYYGGWGPLARFSSFNRAEHYLYEVVSVTAFKGIELNVGVGEGLSKASNPVVFKLIAGYSWE
ncbi:MAG: hypothetical protein QM723_11180 [Myxococcaceae bacterium]